MGIEELIKLLQPHKEKLTTVKEWDVYAKEYRLPSSFNLIYQFESWTNVKKALGLTAKKASYSLEELQNIAKKHKKFMQSKQQWDKYSKENGLPASATFIKAYGKWSTLKEQIGLGNEKRKRDLYSKDDIKMILKKHAEHYLNRKQWDEYAKEKKLPTYKTIKKHFEYDEILQIVGKSKNIHLTKEDLIQIALQHTDIFLTSSMSKWDLYAKEQKLPSSYAFFNHFGSWQRAKYEIRLKQ
jgi:hypothetical protein